MLTHESENWLVLSGVFSKLKDFSRSHAVTCTVNIIIIIMMMMIMMMMIK